MKAATLVVLITACIALCACKATSDQSKIFEDFKRKFNKEYRTQDEEMKAFENVIKNNEEVEEHNILYEQGKVSYSADLFEHSDLSEAEMYQHLSGLDEALDEEDVDRSKRAVLTHSNLDYPTGPASINWTERGIVGPVGNQSKNILEAFELY